jgi:hypothetical protein
LTPCLSSGSFSGFGGGKQISQRKLLRIYDSILSEVAPRIFVGADEAARDLTKLRQAKITHIVNCAAATCPNHFEPASGEEADTAGKGAAGGPPLEYLSLYLQDSLREDISRAFYDSIEFIDQAIEGGGSVLIHCQHGVSRSATIAMAHLMWRDSVGYEEALDRVRSIRPTVNPNIGFACALLAWQGATLSPPVEALAWELSPDTGELRPLSYEPGLGGRALLEAVRKVPAETAPAKTVETAPAETVETAPAGALGQVDGGQVCRDCPAEGERLLVFQRGPGAACWVGGGGAVAPAAALSGAEARLRRFHRLPSNAKIRVLSAGSEDASFWQLLGGEPAGATPGAGSRLSTPPRVPVKVNEHPPASAPELLGSARSGVGTDGPAGGGTRRHAAPASQSADALRTQMQAAALQHVLVEISLALPSGKSCAGSCAGSPVGSLHGSLSDYNTGSGGDATPLAGRDAGLTIYEMERQLLDPPAALSLDGTDGGCSPPDLAQLGGLQDGHMSAIARLAASQDLLAQPVMPEHSGEVRQVLAWLLEELIPELAGTYLAPLTDELHQFGLGLAPSSGGGAHGGEAPAGDGIDGEDLLAAEERLVARIHQARDEAEAECEAAAAEAEAAATLGSLPHAFGLGS